MDSSDTFYLCAVTNRIPDYIEYVLIAPAQLTSLQRALMTAPVHHELKNLFLFLFYSTCPLPKRTNKPRIPMGTTQYCTSVDTDIYDIITNRWMTPCLLEALSDACLICLFELRVATRVVSNDIGAYRCLCM